MLKQTAKRMLVFLFVAGLGLLPQEVIAQTTRFAVIGDFGSASYHERAVADMIASWDVDFIITTGDNRYGTKNMDQVIGQFYCAFLKDAGSGPYCMGGQASRNAFFPSIGNHEYKDGTGINEYYDYFTLPGSGISNTSGNERYYDFVMGPVHFFVLNSNPQEPHGVTGESTQANWLRAQMARSTSRWKFVYMHHPPYSSGTVHGSEAYMQWPFADWGADAVFSGHDHTYERIERDGIVYFVNGAGGKSLYSFGTPISGSKARYSANYGAQLVEVTADNMITSFMSVDEPGGTEIDTHVLTKPTLGLPFASFTFDPESGTAPLKVTFDASGSSDSNGSIVTWAWNFGDDSSQSGKTVTRTYRTPGRYSVALTVTDNDDNSHTAEREIEVLKRGYEIAEFQDGIDGYSGTSDTKIKSETPSGNFGTAVSLEVDGSPDSAVLLKWIISSIPPGSKVEVVNLELTVTNAGIVGQNYELLEVRKQWSETQATWERSAASDTWSSAGAQGLEDRGTGPLGTLETSSTGRTTIRFNAAGEEVVQSWVDNPGSNYGIILQDYTGATNGIDFRSSEYNVVSDRPKLTIAFIRDPLSVELIEFYALASGRDIQLYWETATETDNAGFEIEHAVEEGMFSEVAFIAGAGSTTESQVYEYGLSVTWEGLHRFRLRQFDLDGTSRYGDEIEVYILPQEDLTLYPAFPNPFSSQTEASFAVRREQTVRAELYDATGRLVSVLYDGHPVPGRREPIQIRGDNLTRGVYFLQISGAFFQKTLPVVRLD